MRVFNNFRVSAVALLIAFLLVIGTTSCGDSDKKGAGAGAGAGAGGSAIPLGAAAGCAILAGSTVTNTGPTVITGGDVCLSPGSSVVGFPPGTVSGSIRVPPDPIPAQAQLDLTTAYNNLAGKPGGASLPGDITGLTFTPGIYKNASSVGLLSSAGQVTLNGLGDANAVFIFQIGSTLTTATSSQVILSGGTQAKNVYWQVGSSATLGLSSVFNGNILALTSITLNNGATLNGRALARNGAVTLDSNPVTVP